MGLTWREQDEIWSMLRIGLIVEFTYDGNSGKGPITSGSPLDLYKVQLGWQSHGITKYGLNSGKYSKLIINGKKFI